MASVDPLVLPRNLERVFETKDFESVTKLLSRYDVDARGEPGGRTALMYKRCSDELSRWLVQRGADIDATDRVGMTALMHRIDNYEPFGVLLALGADVTRSSPFGGTALHFAAKLRRTDFIRSLLEAGAPVDAEDNRGRTPLAVAMKEATTGRLTELGSVTDLLLAAGATKQPSMRDEVARLGKQFEGLRDAYARELVGAADAALRRLYETFDVAPAPRRVLHDGTSPIAMPPGTWQQQHSALWDLCVPAKGPATTIQGEVIRISGRIASEMHRNGGLNWDRDFRGMLRAFVEHVQSGSALSASDLSRVNVAPGKAPDEAVCDDLMRCAVHWVTLNPVPVPLPPTDYSR